MIDDTRTIEIDLAHRITADVEQNAYYQEMRRQDVIENQAGVDNASTLTRTRQDLTRGGSTSLDPRRDINEECGFPLTETVTLRDYDNLYQRDAIAARVVEVWPRTCWKITPNLRESEELDAEPTAFEKAWKDLPGELKQENWMDSGEGDEGNPVWETMEKVDIACGIGTFGVILIGLDDGKKLDEPVDGINEHGKKVGGKAKSKKLTFLRVFSEIQAQVNSVVNDDKNPRHGKPEFYTITMDSPDDFLGGGVSADVGGAKVHWSRVIHIADNTLSSETHGVPRCRPVLNELLSLQKVRYGDGEIWWSAASRDLILESHPQLGGKVRVNMTKTREDLEKFRTGLQRELVLLGLSAKDRSPSAVDPTPHVQVQIDAICIRLEVPKRLFMGSERGELSSSQDADETDERADRRRNRFCTPDIIGPLVNRLITIGVLPVPEQVFVDWSRKDSMSPLEKAQVTQARMEAASKYVGGGLHVLMAPADFLTREMDYDAEEAKKILEAADEYAEEQELEDEIEGSGEDEDVIEEEEVDE